MAQADRRESMNDPARVAVTAAGVVSPLGFGLAETLESLQSARDCVSPVMRFSVTECRCKTAGQVSDARLLSSHAQLPRSGRLHRASHMMIEALQELLTQQPEFEPELAVVGTTSGGMSYGERYYRSLQRALESAHIFAADIDYINAHGTATLFNDAAEGKAISALFNGVPVSSTKSMMGHSLGAAGAIEAVVCLLALEHQFLPANINFSTPDDDVDLNIVANEARPAVVNAALSNSFGFGGTNASVLMRKFPPSPRLPRTGDA